MATSENLGPCGCCGACSECWYDSGGSPVQVTLTQQVRVTIPRKAFFTVIEGGEPILPTWENCVCPPGGPSLLVCSCTYTGGACDTYDFLGDYPENFTVDLDLLTNSNTEYCFLYATLTESNVVGWKKIATIDTKFVRFYARYNDKDHLDCAEITCQLCDLRVAVWVLVVVAPCRYRTKNGELDDAPAPAARSAGHHCGTAGTNGPFGEISVLLIREDVPTNCDEVEDLDAYTEIVGSWGLGCFIPSADIGSPLFGSNTFYAELMEFTFAGNSFTAVSYCPDAPPSTANVSHYDATIIPL